MATESGAQATTFELRLHATGCYRLRSMAHTTSDETAPATKADIAALFKRFDNVDQRFQSVDQRFDAIDRRFAAMDDRLDNRFDYLDRRFDAVDFQFERVIDCIASEGRLTRNSAARARRETCRHIDFTDSSLRRFLTAILDYKSAIFGENRREQERRLAALERGH